MLSILVGLLLGIFICLFVPPRELAIKIIKGTLKLCDLIQVRGKEQLKKFEEENEKAGNTKQDSTY